MRTGPTVRLDSFRGVVLVPIGDEREQVESVWTRDTTASCYWGVSLVRGESEMWWRVPQNTDSTRPVSRMVTGVEEADVPPQVARKLRAMREDGSDE